MIMPATAIRDRPGTRPTQRLRSIESLRNPNPVGLTCAQAYAHSAAPARMSFLGAQRIDRRRDQSEQGGHEAERDPLQQSNPHAEMLPLAENEQHQDDSRSDEPHGKTGHWKSHDRDSVTELQHHVR